MKILSVQASAGMERSLTRKLAADFLDLLKMRLDQVEIEELDLVTSPPPFITPEWIAGAFSNTSLTEQQRMALVKSDEYISQIEAADCIVIGTPMYNYGMPAVLKAWFDQIARINKTFSFDLSRGDFPIEPVLSGKKMLVFTATGEFDFQKGGTREGVNHLVPHIKSCAHYLGVTNEKDFYHLGIEYQEFKDERHDRSKNAAFANLAPLVEEILPGILKRSVI
jgi:FMN-dependent NADH-azoreductase